MQRDVDLIEEVVRAYGVDKIPGTDRSRFTPASVADHAHDLGIGVAASAWQRAAFDEVRTSKLIPRERFAFSESAIELRNPLSEDHVALRPSFLAGLFGCSIETFVPAQNASPFSKSAARLFRHPAKKNGTWEFCSGEMLQARRIGDPQTKPQPRFVRSQRRAGMRRSKSVISPGQISRSRAAGRSFLWRSNDWFWRTTFVARKSNAPGAVFVAEVHADLLLNREESATKFREIERFPSVTRDIAMIVPEEIDSRKRFCARLKNRVNRCLESVELFDLFSGGEIGGGTKVACISIDISRPKSHTDQRGSELRRTRRFASDCSATSARNCASSSLKLRAAR